MTLKFEYWYDDFGCEVLDDEVEIPQSEYDVFVDAVIEGKDFENFYFNECKSLRDVAVEITEYEHENMLEIDDDYAEDCGETQFDEDEIADYIAEGDEDVLAYFGLQDLDEDELEDFDVSTLGELPKKKEVFPDMYDDEPLGNAACDLVFRLGAATEENILDIIKYLLDKGETEKAKQVVAGADKNYKYDLDDLLCECKDDDVATFLRENN